VAPPLVGRRNSGGIGVSTLGKLDLAFVGFGEAASAFVEGWGPIRPRRVSAYDIKTDHASAAVREAKEQDYRRWSVNGSATLAEALSGSTVVISLVTADQALAAARGATACIQPGTLYLDGNSCAPGTKRQAAGLIDGAGGRYVDVAIMAPMRPALHRVPTMISGPHALAAREALDSLRMCATLVDGPVGAASSIKMVRSVMVKGLEALMAECLLAGRRAGVDEQVLDSLEGTFPGFHWKERAGYMLERAIVHGVRRAAEMREAAETVEELGLPAAMTHAAAQWQQRIGELGLTAPDGDYRLRAEVLLQALVASGPRPAGRFSDDYHDIPGTYVFDAEQSRRGYHLNMFCMSLNQEANRAVFRADESAYLDRFPITAEQKAAVLERQWNEMLRLGGNIYYTAKLAANDGLTFQDLAARMTGVSREEYRQMMLDGGRPIAGNRSKSEWLHG
jgi:protocatechuate 4,5-dioxygenase alpha subunit